MKFEIVCEPPTTPAEELIKLRLVDNKDGAVILKSRKGNATSEYNVLRINTDGTISLYGGLSGSGWKVLPGHYSVQIRASRWTATS